jgi:hypothetical protein
MGFTKFQLFVYKVTFRHATEDFFFVLSGKNAHICITIFVNTGNVILLWMLKLQIIFITDTKNYSCTLDWWRLPWVCPAFVVLSRARYFFYQREATRLEEWL